jgi:hypothetical protein
LKLTADVVKNNGALFKGAPLFFDLCFSETPLKGSRSYANKYQKKSPFTF